VIATVVALNLPDIHLASHTKSDTNKSDTNTTAADLMVPAAGKKGGSGIGRAPKSAAAIAPRPAGKDSDAVFLGATLTGRDVVSAPGRSGGDGDGVGSAVLRIIGTQICYSLTWSKIGAPTLIHVHAGKQGVNGVSVVMLVGTAMPDNVRAAAGCVEAGRGVVLAVSGEPDAFYVAVHNDELPGGAVRGQFRTLDSPVQLDGFVTGELLAASTGQAGASKPGVPNATFVTGVSARGTRVNFAATWAGMAVPTVARIHSGRSVAGKSVVSLFNAPAGLSPDLFAVAGVSGNTSPDVIKAIQERPGEYYVNLRTAQSPEGFACGQMTPGTADLGPASWEVQRTLAPSATT
jgi:hypothetical protein